jgi:hypothetical protein
VTRNILFLKPHHSIHFHSPTHSHSVMCIDSEFEIRDSKIWNSLTNIDTIAPYYAFPIQIECF